MAAHQLMSAIKAKCTPDEAAQLLRELPNKFPNGEDNGQLQNFFFWVPELYILKVT